MRASGLLMGVASLALALPAWAQGASPAEGEIIVTGRRVAETLQDAPLSVTVITESALQSAGIETTEDFVQLTPGVTIVTGTAEVGDTQINIRGLNGARDAEPSVALIVDGILKTNTAALAQDQGDLTQVEILKGPQGALYGRNAAAGAIVLQTRKPGDSFVGRARVSAAEDKTFSAFASLSGPIGDGLALLVSGDHKRTRGQYQITGPGGAAGQYVDRYSGWNVNARLVAELGPDTEFDLKARLGKVDAGAINFNAAFALPAFAAFLNNPDFFEDVNKHKFIHQPNIAPDNNQRTIEISGKIDHDFGGVNLTAWAAFSDIDQDFLADGTSGAFGFFNQDAPCRQSVATLSASGFQLPSPQFLAPTPEASVLGPYTPTLCDGTQYQVRNQRDISAEARISGQAGAVDWQAGVYFLDLEREVGVNLGIDRGRGVLRQLATRAPENPTEQLVHDRFDTRVFAVFAAADVDLSDSVTVSGALRYDNEKREVTNLVPTGFRTQYVDFDGPPFTGGAPLNPGLLFGPILPQEKTFSQVQPKFSIAWKPDPSFTAYANYGRGFKSGGFNNQGSRATIDLNFNQTINANLNINDVFRKETSHAFEVGAKASRGPVSLEVAGFYTRVRDLQFFEFFVGTFGLLRVVSNIDRVDIWGGEASANWRVIDGVTLFAAGSVLGSEIKKNTARPDTVGNESPYTADFTVNVGAQADYPLDDDFSLIGRVDARIVGPTWFSTVQAQERPTLFGVPADYSRTLRDTYTLVNLRAGVGWRGWQIVGFAQNLTDKAYLDEVIPAPEFGGSFISPGAKRRFGVEVSTRF